MASGPSHGERGSQTCRVVTKIFAQAVVEHTSAIDEIEFQSLEYANLCGFYIITTAFHPNLRGTRYTIRTLQSRVSKAGSQPVPFQGLVIQLLLCQTRRNSKRSYRLNDCANKIHDCGVNLAPAE